MTSSSRSLITRLAANFSARLRYNSRLLSSSSAMQEPQPSSAESQPPVAETIHISDTCVRRMKELQADEAGGKMLRLSIEAGGCSGFQYNFSLDEKINVDDKIFERDGVRLVVDNISFDFVKGATVDYVEELIRSAFQKKVRFKEISSIPVFVVLLGHFQSEEVGDKFECDVAFCGIATAQEVSLPFGHSSYTIGKLCSNIKIMSYTNQTSSTRLYYLRKVAPILLSVSVFSYLFSQSPPAPLLLHWYDHVVSNLYAKLFSYTPQRNYIFLLFNGILVLILRTSGLINKIRPPHSWEKGVRIADYQLVLQEIPLSARKSVEEIVDIEVESNEDDESNKIEIASIGGIDEEIMMSMDELNKKCEDFIMRVKQEIQAA